MNPISTDRMEREGKTNEFRRGKAALRWLDGKTLAVV